MNVIGLSGDCEHNSAVALLRDGETVFAETEERLSRIKGDGAFPRLALAHALESTGPGATIFAAPGLPVLSEVLGTASEPRQAAISLREQAWFEIELLASAAAAGFKVERVDHHLAHARCAAYLAGFDDGLVITADGQGGGVTTAVWRLSGGELERLWHTPLKDGSLGFFFAAITEFLGYRRLFDEGKVTALAAYGETRPELDQLMMRVLGVKPTRGTGRRMRANPTLLGSWRTEAPLYTDRLARELAPFHPADIARAAQARLEAVVLELVAPWLSPRSDERLALAGGLFANVGVNKRLAELAGVELVMVAPPMGDEGLALGAAVEVARRRKLEIAPCPTMYLGSQAATGDVETVLSRHPNFGFASEEQQGVLSAARLLACGELVARCAGPGEFGPRALGNRSILYRPDDPSCRDWLNRYLGRDPVMPFAPCVRRENLPEVTPVEPGLFGGLETMTVAVPMTRAFQRLCPGVVHRDGTARVQAVRKDIAPVLWSILKHFQQLTGLPALLNTSLNRHGEPICGTLDNALTTAAASGIDYLLLDGDRLLCRRKRSKEWPPPTFE